MRVRSFNEFLVRGHQETIKTCERLFGFGCGEMSDAQLLRQLSIADSTSSIDEVVASIIQRMATPASPLFGSWGRREKVREFMTSRFPDVVNEVIERADRVCANQFDLLGLKGLHFGCPIDWHLEPIARRRTPRKHWSQISYLDPQVAGDKKIIWELHRHQFFVTLGQAYCLTGDEQYAGKFENLIWSWMEENPPKQGIAWASSLELAFRLVTWIWALHLFAGSTGMSVRVVRRMLKYFVAQGRHIETNLSYYFSPNTHLTGEALGLFYLGSVLPELHDSDRWKALGLKILLQQLPVHVHEDGVYFEQSSYYHRYTTEFYLHLYLMARAQNELLPAIVERKLQLLLEHLMWISRPDGTSPYIGDDDGGVLVPLGVRQRNDFRDTLAAGAAIFRRPEWKSVAGRDCPELVWLLGTSGSSDYDSLDNVHPGESVKSFNRGGYFVIRSGWSVESSYLLIDCGPHGVMNCGHAHADALSFEFAAGGTSWIVDPGTYTYTGNAEQRNYFRSALAHNTVVVDSLSQSVPSGPFSWSTIGRSQAEALTETAQWVRFIGQHDGYRRLTDPVTHIRTITIRKSGSSGDKQGPYVVIHDRLDAKGKHRFASYLHFTPQCRVMSATSSIEVSNGAGQNLLVVTVVKNDCVGTSAPRAWVEEGWVSPCYGSRLSAPVLVRAWEAEGVCTCTTVLIPPAGIDRHEVLERVAHEIGESAEFMGITHDVVRALADSLRAGVVGAGAGALR